MSAIDSLVGLSSTSSLVGSNQQGADRNTLARDDFYKIMISELSNQDPFEPMDNQQFLEQMVSLQTMDTTAKLTDGINALLLQQKIASASALIGREIRALSANLLQESGGELQGTVERVRVASGEVELILEGDQPVKLEEVVEIS